MICSRRYALKGRDTVWLQGFATICILVQAQDEWKREYQEIFLITIGDDVTKHPQMRSGEQLDVLSKDLYALNCPTVPMHWKRVPEKPLSSTVFNSFLQNMFWLEIKEKIFFSHRLLLYAKNHLQRFFVICTSSVLFIFNKNTVFWAPFYNNMFVRYYWNPNQQYER